jgi:hypothetical protein
LKNWNTTTFLSHSKDNTSSEKTKLTVPAVNIFLGGRRDITECSSDLEQASNKLHD